MTEGDDLKERSVAELCLLMSAVVSELQRRVESPKPITMRDLLYTPGVGKVTSRAVAETLREHGIKVEE